ncbi:MAG: hypothetical protein PVF58_08520 [Candidatus Methanofastidiosia archaeon]
MDRKISVILCAAAVLCIATSITGSMWTTTPLYRLRMEQASNKMNFLPTRMNGFTYTAESGYNVNYCVGSCNVNPLEELTVQDTCPNTCDDYTCIETCPDTCLNTCSGNTCEQTCSNTCLNTCSGDTCEQTCSNTCPLTCGNTCQNTCPNTCSGNTCDGSYTCKSTCETCDPCQ